MKDKHMMLWVLPAIMLVLSAWLRFCSGPFWLGLNNDPAYLYLFNSLYIIDSAAPTFIQHPGTTLQVFGAWIIQLFNLGVASPQIIERVIQSPEFYLNAISLTLAALAAFGWLLLGVVVKRITGSLLLAMTCQAGALPVFCVFPTLDVFLTIPANVGAETMIMALMPFFLTAMIGCYASKTQQSLALNSIGMGLLVGLLIATKWTMLPFIIIPLMIIASIRCRLLMMLAAVMAFFIAILPAWANHEGLFGWVKDLLVRTGHHGRGQVGFVDAHVYGTQLLVLFQWFWPVLILTTGVIIFVIKDFRKKEQQRERLFVFASAITIVLLTLMVAKQIAKHYMTPALYLLGPMMMFAYLAGFIKREWWGRITIISCVLMVAVTLIFSFNFYRDSRARMAFSEHVYQTYADKIIMGYYRCSSIPFALQFGDDNAGRKAYGAIIQKYYPQHYFLQLWEQRFDDSAGPVFAQDLIKNKSVVLFGDLPGQHYFDQRLFQTRLIEKANGEGVFELILPRDRDANQLTMMAKMAFAQGQYQTSYGLAQQAYALGLPEAKKVIDAIENMIKATKK